MKRGLDIELMFETIIVQKRKDFPSKLRVMSPPTSTNRLTECSMPTAVESQDSNINKQGDNFEPKSLKVMTTALKGTKDNGYTCPTCEPGFEYTP